MTYDLQRNLEDHGVKVRRLFAHMCQIYSGGKGIGDLGDALLDAAISFNEISNEIESKRGGGTNDWWQSQQAACRAIEHALRVPEELIRDLPEDSRAYDHFAQNVAAITQESAKVLAHVMLGHPGNGSRAKSALMETVTRVGAYHARAYR